MEMQCEIRERRVKKVVKLNATITFHDFFIVLCLHYELAARFILDWYASDSLSSINFIATFLSKVRKDLNLSTPYLYPKKNVKTELQSQGQLWCNRSLFCFCDLLYESPELVKAIKEDANYRSTTEGMDFYLNRESSYMALTRGTVWGTEAFRDPQPIPDHVREKFYEQCRLDKQKNQERRDREDRERQEAKARKRADRFQAGLRKTQENKIKSEQRRLFREHFLSMSLIDQVKEFATNNTYPVSAFPILTKQITNDIIVALTIDQRHLLISRLKGRREKDWISLQKRIEEITNDNNCGS